MWNGFGHQADTDDENDGECVEECREVQEMKVLEDCWSVVFIQTPWYAIGEFHDRSGDPRRKTNRQPPECTLQIETKRVKSVIATICIERPFVYICHFLPLKSFSH